MPVQQQHIAAAAMHRAGIVQGLASYIGSFMLDFAAAMHAHGLYCAAAVPGRSSVAKRTFHSPTSLLYHAAGESSRKSSSECAEKAHNTCSSHQAVPGEQACNQQSTHGVNVAAEGRGSVQEASGSKSGIAVVP